MKRLLLLAALSACIFAAWAETPTPVTNLTNGGTYFIYDAHGDDGTDVEQAVSQKCRYCFRYDDGTNILGTHTKPASAANATSLEKKHAWVAEQEGDAWTFRNVATNKYIAVNNEPKALNRLDQTGKAGTFNVVTTNNEGKYWDGIDDVTCSFTWWAATNDKHPYMFFAAEPADGEKYKFSIPSTETGESYTFQISPDKNNLKWQAWFMNPSNPNRDNRYTVIYTPESTPNVKALCTPRNDAHPDTELWAFVKTGDNGVKIYNQKAGLGMALKNDPQNGASLVPEDDATTWEIATSATQTDAKKYFSLKVPGETQYLNKQGDVLKQWKDADNGSTGWVEKKFQPVVDYYTAESTYDTTRPDVQGCVGDFVSDEAAKKAVEYATQGRALAASLNADNVTTDQLAKLQDYLTKLNECRIKFNEKITYRIYNVHYKAYIKFDQNYNLVGGGNEEDDNAVTFTKVEEPNKYYISMGSNGGKYFGNVTKSAQVGTSDTQVAYTISTLGHPYTFIFQGGNDPEGKSFLHEESGQHKVVGWGQWANGSNWYLVPITTYPFQITTDKNNPKWQAWFMNANTDNQTKDGRYTITYTSENTPNVEGLRTPRNDAHPEAELWAFVKAGRNMVKIYNKAAGMEMALKHDAQNGASLAPEAEATVYEIATPKDQTDTDKFFCFKVSGADTDQYLNTQRKDKGSDAIQLLKNWTAADNGSTGWVEKTFQPVVDYYSSESAYDISRPAIQDVVGDFISEEEFQKAQGFATQGRAFAATLNPDNVTDEQLAKLKDFQTKIAGLARVEFSERNTYRLYNEQYNNYIKFDGSYSLVGGGTADDDNAITFTKAEEPDKYYLSMGSNGRFFGNVTTNGQVGTSETRFAYTINTIGRPYSFILQGANGGDQEFLHQAGGSNKIVGWGRWAGASHWLIVPTGETTNLSQVANVDADCVVYDLQGRRVANPTAGIYIINGRKVLIK